MKKLFITAILTLLASPVYADGGLSSLSILVYPFFAAIALFLVIPIAIYANRKVNPKAKKSLVLDIISGVILVVTFPYALLFIKTGGDKALFLWLIPLHAILMYQVLRQHLAKAPTLVLKFFGFSISIAAVIKYFMN